MGQVWACTLLYLKVTNAYVHMESVEELFPLIFIQSKIIRKYIFTRDLGVIFDSNLNFDNQIQGIFQFCFLSAERHL